jgi:hypothetical protein
MNFNRSALALALAGTLAASAAMAGEADDRAALSRQLLDRWSGHVEEAHKQPGGQWAQEMAPLLDIVSLDDLRKAAASPTFDAMNDALLGKTGDGGSTQSLGDIATDLVYVPVAPCRLFDTRVAGGAIAANTTRGFDVTAVSDYSFQGGSATNCNGVGAAGSFAAAAINFTVVAPSAAGYITAFPFGGSQPLASSLNYSAGSVVGNLSIVQLDQGASANEISVYTFAQTHLVADIVGYYINPQATALQCVDTADTSTPVQAGATANSNAPACPAGYTQTATNCESSTWQMPFVFFSGGTCSAQNNSAGAATLRSSRTCCRVPGR